MPDLRFGYEEALGYCCDPEAVNDKDGITASLLMLEMVAALKAEGRGVPDVLDDLARKFGLYATSQLSVRVSDVSLIAEAMGHHPEWSNVWNRLTIALTTHDTGGLSNLDREMARRIDGLLA